MPTVLLLEMLGAVLLGSAKYMFLFSYWALWLALVLPFLLTWRLGRAVVRFVH